LNADSTDRRAEAPMSTENSVKPSVKQKVVHEFREIAIIFIYLAFFFCALATYSMLLLGRYHISYYNYGAALLNALIITKVILIGEALHYGTKYESRPIFYSAIYKAFLFGLLVFAFHIVEELVKRLIHGQGIVGAFQDIRLDDVIARSVIIFCAFIPLFAFRELGRVLGPEKLRSLAFHEGPAVFSDQVSKD
jgi:magnesium-transporting ATPase (P-type)